jgi:hydrogenase-1 operon protein HyaF
MSDLTPIEREIIEKVFDDVKEGLAALLETGAPQVIDLRRLPRMSEAVYNLVKETLGRGEASILIDTGARVEITETSFPGVWWATYFRSSGEIATEMIEISLVPRLLTVAKGEALAGLNRLKRREQDSSQAA